MAKHLRGPTFGNNWVSGSHPGGTSQHRSPNGLTFEDRDPNYTLWAEDDARKVAWQWAKQLYRIRGTALENEDTFFSPKMEWRGALTSNVNPGGFWCFYAYELDGIDPEEMEPSKYFDFPTTVITATGSIDTTQEATVKDLDMFVTVQLFEDSPAEFSVGKTLRRKWVFISVERRSNTKSYEQFAKLRQLHACRCPWFIE